MHQHVSGVNAALRDLTVSTSMSIRPEVCTLYSRSDMSMNLQLQHFESAPGPGFLFLQQCFSFNRVQQPDLCRQKQSEFEACQP